MKFTRLSPLLITTACFAVVQALFAQSVTIDSFTVAPDTSRQFTFQSQATNYYVLFRGESVTNITTPVRLTFGTGSATLLEDRTAIISASFYRIATISTNTPLDLDADGTNDVAELIAGSDPLIARSLVINEIDYDSVGSPDTTEFVEIFNPTGSSVSLTNLAVVFINGSGGLQYDRVNLTGSLAAGQYLVIGSTNVINALPSGAIGIVMPDNFIQNGAPDGVLLFNASNNGALDAFSYEGAVTSAIVAGVPTTFNLVEGTALSVAVLDSNTVNGSLNRLPNGTDTDNASSDWGFSTTPTPGAANVP